MCSDSTSITRPSGARWLSPGTICPSNCLFVTVEDVAEPVGFGLVRAEQPEVGRVIPDHVAQPAAEHPGGLRGRRAGRGDVHGVPGEVGQPQVTQQQPAVGVRVRAHPPLAARGQRRQLRDQRAGGVEELTRPVRAQPLVELRQVPGVLARRGERDLVRPPGPLHRQPVHHLGPGPPLGRLQHDGGPGGPGAIAVVPGPALDGADLADRRVHGGRELLVDQLRVVALDRVHLVPVAAQQRLELLGRYPGQHGRVGDLVPVQVQDRQHRAVLGRVEELVRVPAARQRAGLGLAVADHAGHDQVRVIERRPVGVHERSSRARRPRGSSPASRAPRARGCRRGRRTA